jgi:signal peptidase I
MEVRMTRARWIVVAVAAACLMLAVTVGPAMQVVRVEGLAMAPTLDDQDRLIVNRVAYTTSSPQRGDVVMLRYPPNQRKSFVKRVIAVPGDRLRIEDGRVYVNDRQLEDGYVAPDARSHENLGTRVIPAEHYFVMGDRRNNSADSRHWGLVQEHLIIGRVALRFWPSVGTLQ